jgi:hypothetical protein
VRHLTRFRAPGKALRVVLAVVVIGGLGGAVYVSFHRADPYLAFRRQCFSRPGNSVVTLSVTEHSSYMGGTTKKYTMGCQAADGTISARATTNRP